MAMAADPPRIAVESVVAEPYRTGAIDDEVVHPVVHRRQRHGGLEGRAGRIGTSDGLVEQRLVVGSGQLAPLRAGDADIEPVGIETGCGGKRQDIAVGRVHYHAGSAFAAQALMDETLQLAIEADPDIQAGDAGILALLAVHPAIGIDFDAAGAGAAAELLVEFFLDAAPVSYTH